MKTSLWLFHLAVDLAAALVFIMIVTVVYNMGHPVGFWSETTSLDRVLAMALAFLVVRDHNQLSRRVADLEGAKQ